MPSPEERIASLEARLEAADKALGERDRRIGALQARYKETAAIAAAREAGFIEPEECWALLQDRLAFDEDDTLIVVTERGVARYDHRGEYLPVREFAGEELEKRAHLRAPGAGTSRPEARKSASDSPPRKPSGREMIAQGLADLKAREQSPTEQRIADERRINQGR